MKSIHRAVILLLSVGSCAFAGEQSDRRKLIGSWEPEPQASAEIGPLPSWAFASAPNGMRITQREGGEKVADFACGTEGAACEVKTAGKKAMVSLWFNGPRLVELETKGSGVVKRRFLVLPRGGVMEMEVIPIVPGGKTETYPYQRVELSARQK